MTASPSPEEVLEEIRQDRRSGAAELAQKGAKLLLAALKQGKGDEIPYSTWSITCFTPLNPYTIPTL
jgi:hypothetical protein